MRWLSHVEKKGQCNCSSPASLAQSNTGTFSTKQYYHSGITVVPHSHLMAMDTNREVVVVTGFDPFRQYVVNPNWEAAKGLKVVGLGDRIEVYIKEIPVSYAKCQQVIDNIWQKTPKFVIHLGIAPGVKGIILEQTGKNHSYKDRDVSGLYPVHHCCIEGGPESLDSIIDMRFLSKQLKSVGFDVIYSRDAGRYLCDFVYYSSLYHGQGKAALIHVPASGSLSDPDRLVPQLQTIIQVLLRQLETPADTSLDYVVRTEGKKKIHENSSDIH